LNRFSNTVLQVLCFVLIISGITANAETINKEKTSLLIEETKQLNSTRSGSIFDFTNLRAELDNVISQLATSSISMFSTLIGTQSELHEKQIEIGAANSRNTPPSLDIEKLIETEPESSGSDFNTDYMTVKEYINYFTQGRGRQTLETGFTRSGKYRQLVESIFQKEGVPAELIWLAQVESVWKPTASSAVAARGIWQFMPATGKRFGLQQDEWLDERLNVEKATVAAAHYLNILNKRFDGDWLLAMAAYNYGEGAVERAINKCGSTDFWTLRDRGFLPLETSNYVPAILAVSAIAKEPKAYGINVESEMHLEYDSINITKPATLNDIAESLNLPVTTISTLNPELIAGTIPPGGYELRIPKGLDSKILAQLN
jgi:membrane-bound lytic murein transglycosylase D